MKIEFDRGFGIRRKKSTLVFSTTPMGLLRAPPFPMESLRDFYPLKPPSDVSSYTSFLRPPAGTQLHFRFETAVDRDIFNGLLAAHFKCAAQRIDNPG